MRFLEFLFNPPLSFSMESTIRKIGKATSKKRLTLRILSALSVLVLSGCGGGFANGPRSVDATQENASPSPNNAVVGTNESDRLTASDLGQTGYSLNIIHAAARAAPLTVIQNNAPVVALDYGQTSAGTGIISDGGNDVIQLSFQNKSTLSAPLAIEDVSKVQHTIALPLLTAAQPHAAWVVVTESVSDDSITPILILKDSKPIARNQVGLQIVQGAGAISEETTTLNLYLLPDNDAPAATAIGAMPVNTTPLFRSTPQALTTIEAVRQRMVLVEENTQRVLFESEVIDWAVFGGQTVLVTVLDTVTQAAKTASPVKLLIHGDNNQLTALDQSTRAAVQVLHASPDATALEIFLKGQDDGSAPQVLVPAFNYLDAFPGATTAVGVSAGHYDIFVGPDTDSVGDTLVGIDATQLQAGRDYQLILTGRVGDNAPAFQASITEHQTRPLSEKAVFEFTNTVADSNQTMTVFMTPRGEYGVGELLSGNSVDPVATALAFAQSNASVHVPAPAEYDLRVVSSGGRIYSGSLTAAESTVSTIMVAA